MNRLIKMWIPLQTDNLKRLSASIFLIFTALNHQITALFHDHFLGYDNYSDHSNFILRYWKIADERMMGVNSYADCSHKLIVHIEKGISIESEFGFRYFSCVIFHMLLQ